MKIIDTADAAAPTDSMESLWIYNALDCCITSEVCDALLPQTDAFTGPTYAFSRALQAPILEMNMRGVLVDQARRANVLAAFESDIKRLDEHLNIILEQGIGVHLSWRSNAQMMRLFYEIMGIKPVLKRNSAGGYSPTVDRGALEKLRSYFYAEPIIEHILALRELAKKCEVLRTGIDSDGRIRTSFNIAGTNTGRLSSSGSDFGTGRNLQNIEERLRSIFVADPGYKFANIDLEQADSRCLGALILKYLGDPGYLDACESGDLHTAVARMAWPLQFEWTGDIKSDKALAEGSKFYREDSYRQCAKKLGHGCLTEDHEVLTPNGWCPIGDKPPVIMTWTRNNKSAFACVSHWEDKFYTGDIHFFEGTSISAKMTADHRVPYRKDQRGPLHCRPAEKGPGKLMPLGGGYIGGDRVVPARLIAAFMADGHQHSKKKMKFHFHKPRKFLRLEMLCQQYGFPYSRKGDYIYIDGCLPKKAGAFMLNWTAECLTDFLDEYKFWDGYQAKTYVSLFSTDKTHLEWIQTLGRLCGIGGNIQQPKLSGFGSTVWTLQQNARQFASGTAVNWSKQSTTNTRVLCPTVPSSWFYVRRKGRIFVTGNTNYYGKPAGMAVVTKYPQSVIKEFQPRYFSAFPGIPAYHEWAQRELLTSGTFFNLWNRKRRFFGRRNDEATLREAIAYTGQSSTADFINNAMLAVWRLDICQLLIQVHDSFLLQYPEDREDEILPALLAAMRCPVNIKGREFAVPSEAKVGWNWGNFSEQNVDGLTKYRGHDPRTRQDRPALSQLDRRFL